MKHSAVEDTIKEEQSEIEKIASKKAKAKKKQVTVINILSTRAPIDGACHACGLQDKKKTKQEEKDSIKQKIQAENSGPSMRDIELSAINAKLLKDSLEVKSVTSDGNCLYRYRITSKDSLQSSYPNLIITIMYSIERLRIN